MTIGGGDDLSVKLWSAGGELVASVTNKQAEQYGGAIASDSRVVAIAASAHRGAHAASRAVAPKHGQVSVFAIEYAAGGDGPATGLSLAMNLAGHVRGVGAVDFARDDGERRLALAAKDGAWSIVATHKLAAAEPKEVARGRAPGDVPFERVALSAHAKRLVGATHSTLSIIDVTRSGGALLETVAAIGHGRLTALSLSADGLRCLTAGEDGRLRLWKVAEEHEAGRV